MLIRLFRALLNLVLPPRGSEALLEALVLDDLLSLQTEDGLPYHERAYGALVWELKYYANARAAALCGELLAEELTGIAAEELGRPLLVPVPMHQSRRRARGHNGAELLCTAAMLALSRVEGRHLPGALEYAPAALVRVVNTRQQQGLERSKRLRNVQNSMRAEPALVTGRICIVVDDVKTTGATLAEATRALKAAGATRVHTLALAYS